VFTEAVIRGFVPRLVYAGKRRSDEGVVFSQTIWNFDDRMSRTAPIAPSMPGNLFESGGIAFVACGAALWALLLGWIDRLKATVSTGAATGIHALFALQAFAGIERDFPHTVSSILQNLVILVAVCLIAGTDSSVSIPLSRAARAEFQRTKPRHS